MPFKMFVRKFRMGIPEIAIILLVGILIFGAAKLPQIGKALGKGLRSFKKAQDGDFDNDDDDEKEAKVESVTAVAPENAKAAEPIAAKNAEPAVEQKSETAKPEI